jgi:hypothetical protein
MTDDGIRERHGMQCVEQEATTSNVLVYEGEQTIRLNSCAFTRKMTPAQARYLARKLYRLARRVEQRGQP